MYKKAGLKQGNISNIQYILQKGQNKQTQNKTWC